MKRIFVALTLVTSTLLALVPSAQAARVMIAADDWIFTDAGFSSLPTDTANFALNVAEFVTGGTTGTIHAYSDFQSLNQSSLVNTLNNAGYTYTTGTGITFDLATLSAYDALFLGHPFLTTAELEVLTNYVNGGGGAYIHAGWGGNTGPATAWNTFLSQYGLAFGSTIDARGGNISISSSDPLLNGVSALYMLQPHTLAGCCVVATAASDGMALIASTSAVPIPATVWLFGSGILGLVSIARRKKAA
jgi:hypothetical protein